ncbi:hypothetical protein DPMN_112111 [Dreissena polymorpha]|uniref:RING-type domain-containing protein n=1 Tax=Dreissena polymorpha TaxID=45954 RepID=A0A9D4KFR4_DREPO|nr:hypothetical protein DPMN_112111 [Dreissena polymorpha]
MSPFCAFLNGKTTNNVPMQKPEDLLPCFSRSRQNAESADSDRQKYPHLYYKLNTRTTYGGSDVAATTFTATTTTTTSTAQGSTGSSTDAFRLRHTPQSHTLITQTTSSGRTATTTSTEHQSKAATEGATGSLADVARQKHSLQNSTSSTLINNFAQSLPAFQTYIAQKPETKSETLGARPKTTTAPAEQSAATDFLNSPELQFAVSFVAKAETLRQAIDANKGKGLPENFEGLFSDMYRQLESRVGSMSLNDDNGETPKHPQLHPYLCKQLQEGAQVLLFNNPVPLALPNAEDKSSERNIKKKKAARRRNNKKLNAIRKTTYVTEAPTSKIESSTPDNAVLTDIEIKAINEENSEMNSQVNCKVCLDAVAVVLHQPCNHISVCEICDHKLRKCPICITSITGRIVCFK